MTVDDVRAEVERIRGMNGCDGCGHGAEDDLHQKVLAAIAAGAPDAAELAAAALATLELDHPRWYE